MSKPTALTDREREILMLLAEGTSVKAVAAHVSLAPETIRWYTKPIYAKVGVSSREGAVARAAELGLIRTAVGQVSLVEKSSIRYVSNDGVSIAYQTIGRGPVDLLFMTGFLSHLEASWEDPGYTEFFESWVGTCESSRSTNAASDCPIAYTAPRPLTTRSMMAWRCCVPWDRIVCSSVALRKVVRRLCSSPPCIQTSCEG